VVHREPPNFGSRENRDSLDTIRSCTIVRDWKINGMESQTPIPHVPVPLLAGAMDGSPPPPCRVLVSTQSGRAKACARRTSRILREEYGVALGKVLLFDEDPWFQSQISTPSNDNDNEVVNEDGGTQQDNDAIIHLILFVSTTGDGEHTVRSSNISIWNIDKSSQSPGAHFRVSSLPIRIPSRRLGTSCTFFRLIEAKSRVWGWVCMCQNHY
jgi:hypothetical protein